MLKELADLVRSGKVDPVDLVQESVRRIESARDLNAVTALWADDAVAAAKSHDRKGPLAGLPLLVKDMVRIKGRRTTFGSALFADAAPDTESDAIIERLVSKFGVLPKILAASTESLQGVEGVGETRARSVREGLSRLSDGSLLERYT